MVRKVISQNHIELYFTNSFLANAHILPERKQYIAASATFQPHNTSYKIYLPTQEKLGYYRRKRSCGKAMFSQECVKNSVRGGGDVHPARQTHPLADPLADIPPGRHPLADTHPRADTPPSRQPLQQTVRILLECILVIHRYRQQLKS